MKLIDRLLIGNDLNVCDSQRAFRELFRVSRMTASSAKLFLILLRRKGEHANELAGLVRAVRDSEQRFRIDPTDLIDGCGTGGDGKHTFNISTLACLTAAACGARVAKHGNRGISSACGSSELMSRLGIDISAPPRIMLRVLKTLGFGYFHAPHYHPLFKHIQPIRLELARKKMVTIFNMAGPLLNPLRPSYQFIGVPRSDWAYVLAGALSKLNVKRAVVVSSFKGYDELTATDKALWIEIGKGKIQTKHFIPPKNFYSPKSDQDLTGGTASRNKRIALNILSGADRSVRRDTVVLNAAAMLLICGRVKKLGEGIRMVSQVLDSKTALNLLKRLIRRRHRA